MFQFPDYYGPRGPGYVPATLSRWLYSIEFPAKRFASLLAVLDGLSHGFYKEILFCQSVRVMSKFLPHFLVRKQGYQRALTVKKR
jgi:hypothetical protein